MFIPIIRLTNKAACLTICKYKFSCWATVRQMIMIKKNYMDYMSLFVLERSYKKNEKKHSIKKWPDTGYLCYLHMLYNAIYV
jgi:hypothetical protein